MCVGARLLTQKPAPKIQGRKTLRDSYLADFPGATQISDTTQAPVSMVVSHLFRLTILLCLRPLTVSSGAISSRSSVTTRVSDRRRIAAMLRRATSSTARHDHRGGATTAIPSRHRCVRDLVANPRRKPCPSCNRTTGAKGSGRAAPDPSAQPIIGCFRKFYLRCRMTATREKFEQIHTDLAVADGKRR